MHCFKENLFLIKKHLSLTLICAYIQAKLGLRRSLKGALQSSPVNKPNLCLHSVNTRIHCVPPSRPNQSIAYLSFILTHLQSSFILCFLHRRHLLAGSCLRSCVPPLPCLFGTQPHSLHYINPLDC